MGDSKRRKILQLALLTTCPSLMAKALGKDGETNLSANDAAPSRIVDPVKAAFVYVGPVGDGGWTYSHDQARKSLQAQLGERVVTSYVENVPAGRDAEKAFRDLAIKGNRVIFGTSFGYMDAMLKVAKDHPNVKFHHVGGNQTTANLSVYEARTYEGAYLAGILAGKVTKTGKLGFVGSVPIPEVFRNINAFTLGAQSVRPEVTTQVIWVNKWIDFAKEREAALELIRHGADVLLQNTDSSAVLQAAEEKGVKAFGWDSDMKHYGSKAHVGSAIIDWTPYYMKVVVSLMQNAWKQGTIWLGVRHHVTRIASPNPELAYDLILLLGEKTHEMRAGRLHPFQGPVINRDGGTVIASGVVPDDAALRRMDYFVKGVQGSMK
ncbi:BMP family ABC transporter substrate-binding protein [Noviherbaspirillum saxi]|uniref:BMP family ABC transporter substrate-binding protein n=1 Tax=Noviherbaspirillum saxi TaxID=2320863 RepID=A0A3A3FKD2_9BURK|nr:BMP family ABC transporter substrate-binding protein [Noviherbaspirillum saxi]RJF91795.1 BMP family ABC transporter substrate-binding protein [Noviherbaspirillum saxi]